MKATWWLPLVALSCSGMADAYVGGGQSGHSTSSPLSNVRPFRELQTFGSCYATTRKPAALTLIATAPGSKEEDKAFRKLVFGEHATCLFGGTRLEMPTVFARGAIAEGLLRSDGVPPEYQLSAPSPQEVRDLHGAARCYTVKHRTQVEALVKIAPGGPEEVAAVADLWDDFRACMPKFAVRLNAPWIRFLLAEALLRLPPDAPAASGN